MLGMLLLLASATYYLYGFKARSDIRRLQDLEARIAAAQGAYVPLVKDAAPEAGELGSARPRPGAGAIFGQAIYPGESLRASFWDDPLDYEPQASVHATLLEGFTPVQPSDAGVPGALPVPTRIRIPAIELDSRIQELEIRDLGDSRAYETPKYVVGHIPDTARPGEGGTGWYFGHLSSPIRGEGSVFNRLPDLADMWRPDSDLYVVMTAGERDYLYRVADIKVIPEAQLKLYDTGKPSVFLVTCVPPIYYDMRLIVRTELVGVKQAGQ